MRSAICLLIFAVGSAHAIGQPSYILTKPTPGAFPIAGAPIYFDAADWPGVARAADNLRADIARVTGTTPGIAHQARGANLIIAGTIGRSPVIDQLIREKKIDVTGVAGKWEAFV